MKRFINKIQISAIFVIVMFFLPQMVFAANLKVELQTGDTPTPLFSVKSMAPGETVSRWIKVENLSDQPRTFAIEPINVVGDVALAEQMDMVIRIGALDIYRNTVKKFLQNGTVKLDIVPAKRPATYDISVTLSEKVGNGFQGRNFTFDLKVGFDSEQLDDNPGNPGGGGGGGGWPGNGSGQNPPGQVAGLSYTNNENGNGSSGEGSGGGLKGAVREIVRAIAGAVSGGLGEIGEAASAAGGAVGQEGGGQANTQGETKNGMVLGENTQGEAASCQVKYWWWNIGFGGFAVLILLAFWLFRKFGNAKLFLAPGATALGAIIWWWFEPCRTHYYIWPFGIAVWITLSYGWYLNFWKKDNF